MRRPHVYERSVPRARRDAYQVPDGDRAQAARAVLRALPGLATVAEAAGLARLAELLEAACREAERVGGESAIHPDAPPGPRPGSPADRSEAD